MISAKIAIDEWVKSGQIRSEIELDKFVVMPNHFHAIVKICANTGRGRPTGRPYGKNHGLMRATHRSPYGKHGFTRATHRSPLRVLNQNHLVR